MPPAKSSIEWICLRKTG